MTTNLCKTVCWLELNPGPGTPECTFKCNLLLEM